MMRLGLGTAITAATMAFFASATMAEPCEKPLTAGWEPWPPYQIKTSGEPEGIDPDILREIANITGCEVEFVEMPWKRQLRSAEEGKLDIVPAANKTDERDGYAKWSDSYLDYSSILWVSSDDDNEYATLVDFLDEGNVVGKIRGVTLGEETDSILKKSEYKNQVVENKSTALNVRMISAGRINGLIDNQFVVGYSAKEEGLRDKIKMTDIVVLSDPIHLLFSDRSVSEETVAVFNDAIAQMKESGKLQQIVDKYTR